MLWVMYRGMNGRWVAVAVESLCAFFVEMDVIGNGGWCPIQIYSCEDSPWQAVMSSYIACQIVSTFGVRLLFLCKSVNVLVSGSHLVSRNSALIPANGAPALHGSSR